MDGQMAAATLGVGPQATRDEIRRAFRARVKRVHPDSGTHGSADAFIALRQALEHLLAEAPVEPVAHSVGSRFAGPGSRPWSVEPGSAESRSVPMVDLTDVDRRRPPGVAGPAFRGVGVDPGRQARAQAFGDHLAAALARTG